MIKERLLAGLLSLALCLGNIPVYASDQNTATDISEISETVSTGEQETETEPQIPDITETPEESQITEEPWVTESPEENNFAEEPSNPEDDLFQDSPQAETLTEDEAAEYMENLTIYTSPDSTAEENIRIPQRREDLDQEFGGKVYTVEFSSYASATGFYVSADLTDGVPENSVLEMSGWTLNGQQKTEVMDEKAYTKGLRYRLNGRTFGNGENGSKRAVYTITAGTAEKKQIYKLIVLRRLDLSGIGCYLPQDQDMARNLLNEKFNNGVREYSVTVGEGISSLLFNAKPYSDSYYGLTINGIAVGDTKPVEIPLNDEGETNIEFSMFAENSYLDPEYEGMTYTSEGKYHITVFRQENSGVTFHVNPENAVVSVYDNNGEKEEPSAENNFCYESLIKGRIYQWVASCYGYRSCQGSFTAGEESEISVSLESVDSRQPEIEDNDWINYRNSDTNNGLTAASTPTQKDEAAQKWAVKMGGDWNSAVTPPLILGGYLYAAAGKFIYKMDRSTGEIVAVSDELAGSMVFALNPLTYAEGMLFAQVGGGQIQAISATSLKSLWISEPVGGQTLCPIIYKNGYIYTGTWNSETTAGTYFCLSVTDEDPSKGDETKYCTWKFSHKGGFYWAGAYASDSYVVFGSDDGSAQGNYTNTSILYSVSSTSGKMLDKLNGLEGDIRTSVAYNNGYVYFATKGGYFYRVRMNEDGTFGQVLSYNLGGMATATPVIYKGRIYIGVCGQGGQFNADGGHHLDVLTETETDLSLAYSVSVPGYPQAAPLLSTAYENQDFNGDGKPDGRVYLYFTVNAYPGGIYLLTDEPGQTEGKAEEIFTPDTEQQQYSISTLCVDRDGTIYYKNDSNYMMAIEINGACLKGAEAVSDHGKIVWDKSFRKDRTKYQLACEEGTKKITLSFEIPEGAGLTVNGSVCKGTYTIAFKGKETVVTAIVSRGGKSRTYVFEITGDQSSAALTEITVSTSNTYADTTNRLGTEPAFSSEVYDYTAELYNGSNSYINLFVVPKNDDVTITAEGIRGVKKLNNLGKAAGSGNSHRIAVYFKDNDDQARVKITVKTRTGKTASYQVLLRRTDIYPPILTEGQAIRYEGGKVKVSFTSNEAGRYAYAFTAAGETPEFGDNTFGRQMLDGKNIIDLSVPENVSGEIWIMAKDINDNRMGEPLRIRISDYEKFTVNLKAVPDDAKIVVRNQDEKEIEPQRGKYSFIKGNIYKIEISRDGYETAAEEIEADPKTREYTFKLKCIMSKDADLKHLYVSSSDSYGKGIQKLTPAFNNNKTHYTVVYGAERENLNVWAETRNEKASVKVYALAGIRGSSVQKDETISPGVSEDGHSFWKIIFAEGEKEAKIRLQVVAEDGTQKNIYLTLKLTDKTPPVLKKVSASRISSDQASVVYKSSEKGYRYYKVVDADSGIPKISTKGKGTEIQAGTDTITVTGLTSGEKDLAVVVKDASGNISETLVIRIPDIRGSSGGNGGSGNNAISRPGAGGHKSDVSVPGNGSGEGSKVNMKVVNGTGSDTSTREKNKTDSTANTKKAAVSKSSKKKDKNKTEKSNKSEETLQQDIKEKQDRSDKIDSGILESIHGNSTEIKNYDRQMKVLLIFAIPGLGFLLFWLRAKYFYRRNRLHAETKYYSEKRKIL